MIHKLSETDVVVVKTELISYLRISDVMAGVPVCPKAG
jgi:hypothetical protein